MAYFDVFYVLFMLQCVFKAYQCAAVGVDLQFIVPYHRSAENLFQNSHLSVKQTIKHGREMEYRNLRRQFEINTWLNFTSTQAPAELLSLFCDAIFSRHVNTIVSLNYGTDNVASNSYIMQLSEFLGYPTISWDPQFPGALESDRNSRVLQIAPTIYHQCQGIHKILARYNWTEFAIVTTKISSSTEFVSCMNDIVEKTSRIQGYIKIARYKLISAVYIDIDDVYDFEQMEEREAAIRRGLANITRTTARVIILHTSSVQALDILDIAPTYGLDDSKFMWLLTANSIGQIRASSTQLPIGILAITYNTTKETIATAIDTSVKIWARGLETLARDRKIISSATLHPDYSCNRTQKLRHWLDGELLYDAMKGVRMTSPPVSFSENGVIENVHLEIYNIRPSSQTSGRRRRNEWRQVGEIVPVEDGRKTEMVIHMDEVVWPGGMVSPPKGKPEKRFFRLVTLEEPPYIIYVPPDETGKCSTYAVPCKLNKRAKTPDRYGNASIDENGLVNYCCTGLCVDLLKILSQRLHFDYIMYEVPDISWGIQYQPGEWTGLPKEMIQEKADMVITSIKINQERATAMDFSTPFLETGITIMVALRKGAISATAFLEPFDRTTWFLVMMFSIPVVSAFMFISEWFSPSGLNQENRYKVGEPYDYPSWCLILVFSVHATGASIFIFEWLSPSGLDKGMPPVREHKFSLFRSFWLIWAMLFGASVSTDNPRGMSSRFLANVWALFALVFLASYTANLAAFMITIDEFYDLSGIEDWRLMKPKSVTPHFKFATIPGGSTEDNIRKNYPRMHKYMQKYNKSKVIDGIAALKAGEIHAFIYDATVLEYNAGRDDKCDLITVGKWYAMTGYAVGFPKGSPYIGEVNEVLLELQQNGELDRLQKFWLAGACNAQKDKKDKTSHKIGIPNFTSAFILLASGVTLGTLLLLLEHCYFKFGRTCLKKYDKTGCCALVSLSMGKSLTFEHTVLDAIDYQRRHRCRDPMCETQLWKARHQLDLALLRLEALTEELSRIENGSDTGITVVEDTTDRGQNGMPALEMNDVSNRPMYDRVRHSVGNHVNGTSGSDPAETLRQRGDNHRSQRLGGDNSDRRNADNVVPDFGSDLDKRRSHFRRSPSYTNAISIDSDNGKDSVVAPSVPSQQQQPVGVAGTPVGVALPQPVRRGDVTSPQRCPSYSQAVQDSPMLDSSRENPAIHPQQTHNHARTTYNDGKYYVGVDDQPKDTGS